MVEASGAPQPKHRMVQRPTSELPILHLEAQIPKPEQWEMVIDGLVEVPSRWTVEQIRSMPSEERVWDLHCVWGWSHPGCRWEGVPAGSLLAAARPRANYVVVRAIEGDYASCFELQEAEASLLAWRLDGEDLTPEHGGPLRFVAPENKWGFKSVKWAGRMTITEELEPGFWEKLVGNPRGDMPPEMLDLRFE